jgi:hypothetical protein
MNDAARVSSTWDVHIAYLPPHRWDELAHHDDDALRRITGHPGRPGLVAEPIAWDAVNVTAVYKRASRTIFVESCCGS